MRPQLDAKVIAALVATVLPWASAFAGIRVALDSYNPFHLGLLRFLIASAALLLYALATKMPWPPRRDLPAFALSGLLGITFYHLALNYGQLTVTAGSAGLLIGSSPVWTALLARLVLGERLRPWGWLGIALGFGGVILITLGEGKAVGVEPGALLILLSAVSMSVFVVFQKPYLRTYGALRFTTYTIWAGTLLMLPLAGGLVDAVRAAPLGGTLAVAYLGLFPAALSYVTYAYILSRNPASVTATFMYAVPALSLLAAWAWLGEVPTALALLGGCLCIGGVVVVNTLGRATPPA
ncbi:MAG: EamA family transporter [Chloroflexi bacterium]|nr:EamA family transporter [Chloroflexota bacterium]